MMETVVNDGTGTKAQIPGVTVGGKTGTAQHGVNNSGTPYAWFVSYAKTDQGSPVAVAVVVEDGNANRDDISGGGLAAPIAKKVMEAVLNREVTSGVTRAASRDRRAHGYRSGIGGRTGRRVARGHAR